MKNDSKKFEEMKQSTDEKIKALNAQYEELIKGIKKVTVQQKQLIELCIKQNGY